MIHHILEERLIFLFIKGLFEPLRGMVKVSNLRVMDDVIRVSYDLESIVKYLRGGSTNKASLSRNLLEGPSKAKAPVLSRLDQLDITT